MENTKSNYLQWTTTILFVYFLAIWNRSLAQNCVVGISADDRVTAYVNGVVRAGGNSHYSQYTVNISPQTAFQVLALDVRNDAQLSGLLVVTEPQFEFYSSPSTTWRCTPAASSDQDLSWTQPQYDDSGWQIATSRGTMFDTGPGTYESEARVATGYPIQDARAHWIWTDNYGTRATSSGTDTRIYCRSLIPQTCVQYLGADCDARGGIMLGEVCLSYVGSDVSWEAAVQETEAVGTVLAPVYDESYQAAVRQLMINNGAEAAWVGGKATFVRNSNTWAWIKPCCEENGVRRELAQQGCYTDSPTSPAFTSGNEVTTTSALTPRVCVQLCQDRSFSYAGLQAGNRCVCSDRVYTETPSDQCTFTCPGDSTLTCGGVTAYSIYSAGGAAIHEDTLNSGWASLQPTDGEMFEYCARLDVNAGLIATPCHSLHQVVCEVPADSNVGQALCDHRFTHNGRARCLYFIPASLSWHQGQHDCQSTEINLHGDLITIEDSVVYDVIIQEMRDRAYTQAWVGVIRNPWKWQQLGVGISEYSNFADTEADGSRECLAVDASQDYKWSARACNSSLPGTAGYIQMTVLPTTTTSTSAVTTTITTTLPTTSTSTSTTTTLPTTSPTVTTTPTTTTIPTTSTTSSPTTISTSTPTMVTTTTISSTVTTLRTSRRLTETSAPATTSSPATDPISTDTDEGTASPPSAGANTSNSDDSTGLSTIEIVLLVLVIIIVLIILLVIIIFCLSKKKHRSLQRIGPSKYDARPEAPVPYAASLGDNTSSMYTISESGSIDGLLLGSSKRQRAGNRHVAIQ